MNLQDKIMLTESDSDDEVILLLALQQEESLNERYRFNINAIDNDASQKLFRFSKAQLFQLLVAFEIGASVVTPERYKFTGIEALCILLRRMAFPARWFDLEALFGRSSAALSSCFLFLIQFLVSKYEFILDFDADRIAENLPRFAEAIHQAGAPLEKCWGFLDGTIRQCSRPGRNQREYFNGHKRVHALKFHSIMTPDGLISHMFGPVEGRRHDITLLRLSRLSEKLSDVRFKGYFVYGDPAYPTNSFLISPYKGAQIDAHQAKFNSDMSKVRIAVEWGFGRVVNLWQFLDFKRSLKVDLSPVASFYLVGVLLTNCHCCLNSNQVSSKFSLSPPSLQDYLHTPP